MANLLDWNILEGKVAAKIDSDAGVLSKQQAFTRLMVQTILDTSDEEAEDAITDGADDRGADAVFIDDRENRNEIHIFQFKLVSNFKNSKNNFPSNEIDKLEAHLSAILDEDETLQSNCNAILWTKIRNIWGAFNKGHPSVTIHFCGNMAPLIVDQKKRADTAFGKFKSVEVRHHDIDAIVQYFTEKKIPKISDYIQVVDTNHFERADGNVRGMVCTVEASEIVRIVASPVNPQEINTAVFDQNVRVYLKKNNRINKKIIDSALSEQNQMFWYQNNGITITCDHFFTNAKKRNPKVDLVNFQIVNGGQTSNCLFEAHKINSEKVDDVLVLVRIIETSSEDVRHSIAETTNSQTPINSRDLRSNDAIQKKLEEAFLALGINYERKAKQHADKPKKMRIDAVDAGQAYLAYRLGLPEVAKKDRGRVFGDLCDTIFTEEIIPQDLLAAVRVMEEIEREKRELQLRIRNKNAFDAEYLFLIDGAYHVLFAVAQICKREAFDPNHIETAITHVQDAMAVVKALYAIQLKTDETFSPNRFFKDADTKILVAQAVNGGSWTPAITLPF